MACTTAGVVPAWSRVACNGSTREMSGLARWLFNAEVIGKLYAGMINVRGLAKKDEKKAYELGKALSERIKAAS